MSLAHEGAMSLNEVSTMIIHKATLVAVDIEGGSSSSSLLLGHVREVSVGMFSVCSENLRLS